MWKRKSQIMRISREPYQLQTVIDQKQLENVEYFKYLGSMITNYARCMREIKSKITMTKAALSRKKTFLARKLDLNLRNKRMKCCIWNIASYGAETWKR